MKVGRTLLVLITVIFVSAAILCHVLAFATNYWLKSSAPGKNNFLNIGLWVGCFDNYKHKHQNPQKEYNGCHYLHSDYYKDIQDWLVPSWLVTCRILAVIALVLIAITLVLLILLVLWILCRWICCKRSDDCCERFIIYTTPIMMIVAGMFEMMVAMVFADNAFRLQCKDFWLGGDDPNDNHLSFSWGLEVAACVLSFISGGLIIWLAVLKGRDYTYKVVG